MGVTTISNIIVPSVFNPYVTEKTTYLSALVRSGIAENDPSMDVLASQGGKIINMPFYKDLTGDDEVLSDSSSLTPTNITTGQDQAALLMRGKAWGVNDLAKALSGDDPMAAIGNMVAEYWARMEQQTLIKILTGVFLDNSTNDSSDLIYDISEDEGTAAGNMISASAIITATAKLGDMANKLTAIAMHSVPYTRLQIANLISYDPTNEQDIGWGTYLGKTVIVDDTCPVTACATSGNVYTSYLFGKGAIARGNGAAPVPTETDRNSLSGTDYLVNRRHFILHPRGIKFTSSSVAGASPTNTELAAAANWDRVYQKKNIRIVALRTNG